MPRTVFEGVIGTKEVKISVDVQEARAINLQGDESLVIDFPGETYLEDYPEGLSILLRCIPEYYPVLYMSGKVYILTSEGLKEVSVDNPFVKKE